MDLPYSIDKRADTPSDPGTHLKVPSGNRRAARERMSYPYGADADTQEGMGLREIMTDEPSMSILVRTDLSCCVR